MGGDAGGRGDVDAQRETCCFFPRLNQSLSPLLLSAVMSPPGALTEQNAFPLFHPNKLSFKTQKTSAAISFVSEPRSAGRASVAAAISTVAVVAAVVGGRQSVASALI